MLSKGQNITFWVVTVIFALIMGVGAIPDVIQNPQAVEAIHVALGYPLYFLTFIGIAKILGSIALFVPQFRVIKHWAYAGLMYDLIAATYSAAAVHQPVMYWIPSLVVLAIGAASYYLWQKKIQA